MSPHALSYAPDRRAAWSVALLSQSLVLLIGLVIGIYWPVFSVNSNLASLVLRPGVLAGAVLLGLLWSGLRITWAESHLLQLLLLVLVVMLIPSLTATIVSRALTDWTKLVVLAVVALLLCRGLRDPATARVFGLSLVVAGTLAAALALSVYVREMGWTLPSYTSLRVMKGLEQREDGMSLNSVAFTALFSYICGVCLLPGSRWLWSVGSAIFLICFATTGSRAPLAILAGSILALLIFNGFMSRRWITRLTAGVNVFLLVVGIAAATQFVTAKQMSDITEGRWDLWTVAWQKFTERPITGYGYESWRDDLMARMPGDYQMSDNAKAIFLGGYHDEYLALLAEQGLLGFLGFGCFLAVLLLRSTQLAFLKPASWENGQWGLFGCLFLLLRALIESPGLFGYGQDPADFLAFIFVAIVFSRFSVEEDQLRRKSRLGEAESSDPEWVEGPQPSLGAAIQ